MSSLLDALAGHLGGDTLKTLGRDLGADEARTGTAMAAALPVLLGALSRNASSPDGAAALHGALERDHDGAILDDVRAHVARADSGPGDGILRHVLGERRAVVEAQLGKTTGLPRESTSKLLATLAPVVLGALGREQRSRRLDAGGLAGLLREEEIATQRARPEAAGIAARLLDADGDGDVDLGDAAKHGLGLLGKMFGR